MHDGLQIVFREMPPEERLMKLALAELDGLHRLWPWPLECSLTLSRGGEGYHVRLWLSRGASKPPIDVRTQAKTAVDAVLGAFGVVHGGGASPAVEHASPVVELN
jgi:hypothetical protein